MELVSAATQGVFSIAVAAFLIWHNAKRNEKTDAKVDDLEKYVRAELTDLVTAQGKVIGECTSALCDVREVLTRMESK